MMQGLCMAFLPGCEGTVTSLIYMESYNVQNDLISVPHSTLALRDPNAIAFLVMLHSKPEGSTVSSKNVMEFLKIGKTRFYKARKLLLDKKLITETKKHNREGHFSGVEYGLVSHETVLSKTDHRMTENDIAEGLAQSLQLKPNQLDSNDKLKANQLDVSDKSNSKQKGFRRNFDYPDNFLRVWNSFPNTLGNPGSKLEAFKQFQKLSISDNDLGWLCDRIKNEVKRKTKLRESKEFDPNFQHVCRVLKYRAWESWPAPTSSQEELIL